MKIIIKADKVSIKKCGVESPYDSRPSEPIRLVIKAMHGLTFWAFFRKVRHRSWVHDLTAKLTYILVRVHDVCAVSAFLWVGGVNMQHAKAYHACVKFVRGVAFNTVPHIRLTTKDLLPMALWLPKLLNLQDRLSCGIVYPWSWMEISAGLVWNCWARVMSHHEKGEWPYHLCVVENSLKEGTLLDHILTMNCI